MYACDLSEYVSEAKHGKWGNWHYSHDGYLNLIKNRYDTVDDPFYAINISEINSFNELWWWVAHINGKNKNVYGASVADDLIRAFEDITRHGAGVERRDPNAAFIGTAVVKQFSRYLVSKEKRAVSPRERIAILERDGYTCQLCGARAPEVPLEIDHKHPYSKGGKTDPGNLWVLCKPCNAGKSDRFIKLPD